MMFDETTPVMTGVGQIRSLSESDFLASGVKRGHSGSPSEGVRANMYENKKYHRLIEKRRRDRINECIYQLRDLLPKEAIKSTTRPMEKAVILELVVQHMQSLARKRKLEKTQKDPSKTSGFEHGYKACISKAIKLLETSMSENQKKALKLDLQEGMSSDITDSQQCVNEELTSSQQSDCSSDSAISSTLNDTGSGKFVHSNSPLSSTSLSSPATSENSVCADNSDSSSGNDAGKQMPKTVKRKVFSHHRSSPQKHSHQQNIAIAPAISTPNQTPFFINMPFSMNPGMVSATPLVSSDTSSSVNDELPRMTLLNPTSQIAGGVNSGMQFPTIFMPCMPQPVLQASTPVKQQNNLAETKVVQPTVMMPMSGQGNIVCMPFPMMPQFSAPTFVSVQQTSSVGDSSLSGSE